MFQYAFGRYLSQLFNCPLELDTSWFDYFQFHEVKRRFRLNSLDISCNAEFSSGTKRWVLGALTINQPKVRTLARHILPRVGMHPYFENQPYHTTGYPVTIPVKPSCHSLFTIGYWQTAIPFLKVRKQICNEFKPLNSISEAAQNWLDLILTTNSVFLHVRRGDYANLGAHMLPVSYYEKAVSKIFETCPANPEWFIFSDDLDWCKKHFHFLEKPYYVEYTSANADIEDLWLMRSAKAGIMANSSFSWWASALGPKSRTIITPRYWWGIEGSNFPALRIPTWQAV